MSWPGPSGSFSAMISQFPTRGQNQPHLPPPENESANCKPFFSTVALKVADKSFVDINRKGLGGNV